MWSIYDPNEDLTYELEINPESMKVSQARTLTTTTTATGRPIVFEGRRQPKKLTVRGRTKTVFGLEVIRHLSYLKHQLRVTDHNGAVHWVFFNSVEMERELQRSAEWRYMHTYTIEMTILNWPS